MVRKMMTKEVTSTRLSVASMGFVDGKPVANEMEDVILQGNVSLEKAQKTVSKMYDVPVTVFGVSADTVVYEMDVLEFVKHASVKVEEVALEEESY